MTQKLCAQVNFHRFQKAYAASGWTLLRGSEREVMGIARSEQQLQHLGGLGEVQGLCLHIVSGRAQVLLQLLYPRGRRRLLRQSLRPSVGRHTIYLPEVSLNTFNRLYIF